VADVAFGVYRGKQDEGGGGDPYIYIADGKGAVHALDTRKPDAGLVKLDSAAVAKVAELIDQGELMNAPERLGGGEAEGADMVEAEGAAEGADMESKGGPDFEDTSAGDRFPGLAGARGRIQDALGEGDEDDEEGDISDRNSPRRKGLIAKFWSGAEAGDRFPGLEGARKRLQDIMEEATEEES